MPEGFFEESTLIGKAPISMIPKCGACGLLKKCNTPKMEVSGDGRRKILIVGEAPGEHEDERGVQFVGKSGKHLQSALRKCGIDMRRDCWLTNALICRPPNNATPTDSQLDYCRPNLIETIETLKPYLIIPLGNAAVRSLISWLWRENDTGSISTWAGWRIPSQELNGWICPTYHPSYVIRELEKSEVPNIWFQRHIERALKLRGVPWNKVPDYPNEVEIVLNDKKAAQIIRQMIDRGGRTAFDYETNMLKPDSSERQIVSCSICWRGKKTIAYMWRGEAIRATKEYLLSGLPKVASNMKFEDRWTYAEFGFHVNNWDFDTMLAAHTLDNRKGITSIKFQAFVQLGFGVYDDHTNKFLISKGNNEPNRILQEIDTHDLLTYNALDSLLEYLVAVKQAKSLRYQLQG